MVKENKSTIRRKKILNMLANVPLYSISDLATDLEVTTETIRNDLKSDMLKEKVVQSHGSVSAKHVTSGIDMPYSFRKTINSLSKDLIAKKAASIVEAGQVVVIEHSTIGFLVAHYLLQNEDILKTITLVTNSFSISRYVFEKQLKVKMIFLGGDVNWGQESTVGMTTLEQMNGIRGDISFVSPGSVDKNFTNMSFEEGSANFQKVIIKNSEENVLLLDSSKYPERSIRIVGPVSDFTQVITDIDFTDDEKNYFINNNVTLIKVD